MSITSTLIIEKLPADSSGPHFRYYGYSLHIYLNNVVGTSSTNGGYVHREYLAIKAQWTLTSKEKGVFIVIIGQGFCKTIFCTTIKYNGHF